MNVRIAICLCVIAAGCNEKKEETSLSRPVSAEKKPKAKFSNEVETEVDQDKGMTSISVGFFPLDAKQDLSFLLKASMADAPDAQGAVVLIRTPSRDKNPSKSITLWLDTKRLEIQATSVEQVDDIATFTLQKADSVLGQMANAKNAEIRVGGQEFIVERSALAVIGRWLAEVDKIAKRGKRK